MSSAPSPQKPDFLSLIGKKFGFYGVDNLRFKLGRVVWEAVEDDSDGLRSYLETVQRVEQPDDVFFKRPLATVEIVDVCEGSMDGYGLRDVKDGHIWLLVGTDNVDDYYPSFVFSYAPKEKPCHIDICDCRNS